MKKLLVALDYTQEHLNAKMIDRDTLIEPTLDTDENMIFTICEIVAIVLVCDERKFMKTYTTEQPLRIYYNKFEPEVWQSGIDFLDVTIDEYVEDMYKIFDAKDKALQNEPLPIEELETLEQEEKGEFQHERTTQEIHSESHPNTDESLRTGT